jgi:ABC-2 type transport system permease protein
MNRLWTVMRKEIFHIWRDPRTLAMLVLLPALLLILLGFGISFEQQSVKMAVVYYSKTDASRKFIEQFTASNDFIYEYSVMNEDNLIDLIDRDLVDVGILIPENYDRSLLTGSPVNIPIYIDGSMQPTDSLTLQLKLNSITSMYAQKILIQKVQKSGLAASIDLPVSGNIKTLYNPNGDSKIYMIPGLVAILLQVQTLILSALAIVREREQGTMEQLIVTPVRSWELMLGKIIPYLVVCVFNLFALLWLSQLFFGVTVAGNLGVLIGLSIIFILGSLGMGVLISTISQTQMQAMYILLFVVLMPAIIISGLMFSRENMPAFTYWFSELLPVTQYLEITRGIMVRGVEASSLFLSSTVPLIVLSIGYFTTSFVVFRKRL